MKTTTEKELITMRNFLSKANNDIDVYNNITDDEGVCYCPPIKFTKEGEETFKWTLDNIFLKVYWKTEETEYPFAVVICDDDEEHYSWRYKQKKAFELLYALAGYCNANDFDKWFILV